MSVHALHDRVLAFLRAPGEDAFDDLALEVFRHQYEHVEPYRTYCRRRGVEPDEVSNWREIPPVPVLAFREVEFRCGPAERVFRSSGTTRGPDRRSVHALPDLRLYRTSAVEGMRRFLFPDVERIRILSLVHSVEELPESSLAQMVAWALEVFGTPESRTVVQGRNLDLDAAAEVFRLSERDGQPLALLATTAALVRLLDALAERRWSFRLPHGSRVMDTGGSKGLGRPRSRKGLHRAVWNALAVPGYFFVNEYGMCELSSQAYENVIAAREAGRLVHRTLVTPPWMRTRVLDPRTLRDVPPGERGLLCHYDLANAGTVSAVLTEDVGRTRDEGFELLGRASDAEVRGCSLVWA
ncbi:MAG: coenzyme F390 synthetase [Candidatus Binatia bacterium]|nr:MAG: coenzyme F390 synthetase [Candidatus Binatia bacterium]